MSDLRQDAIEASPQSVQPHCLRAKIIHLGFTGVFIYALTKQLDEVEELDDFSLLQQEMAFAAVFLILLLARFAYMHSTRPTALPRATPERIKRIAQYCHVAMHVSLSTIGKRDGIWNAMVPVWKEPTRD